MTKREQCLLLAAVLERPALLATPRLARALWLSARCFSDPGARWLAREIILSGADRALIRAAAPDPRWLAKFEQWAKTVHPTDEQLARLPLEQACAAPNPAAARVLAAEAAAWAQGTAAFLREQYRRVREAEARQLRALVTR